jgi:hypothetical protein
MTDILARSRILGAGNPHGPDSFLLDAAGLAIMAALLTRRYPAASAADPQPATKSQIRRNATAPRDQLVNPDPGG